MFTQNAIDRFNNIGDVQRLTLESPFYQATCYHYQHIQRYSTPAFDDWVVSFDTAPATVYIPVPNMLQKATVIRGRQDINAQSNCTSQRRKPGSKVGCVIRGHGTSLVFAPLASIFVTEILINHVSVNVEHQFIPHRRTASHSINDGKHYQRYTSYLEGCQAHSLTHCCA